MTYDPSSGYHRHMPAYRPEIGPPLEPPEARYDDLDPDDPPGSCWTCNGTGYRPIAQGPDDPPTYVPCTDCEEA